MSFLQLKTMKETKENLSKQKNLILIYLRCILDCQYFYNFKNINMKNLILCSLVFMGLTSNQAFCQNADTKALYEKNLATLKASITAFENEKIDVWASYIADNAVWTPPSYGSAKGTKDDWKKALSMYMADWDNLKLVNASFLPGLDSTTHNFDGSVRYYGEWTGVHKSGVKTSVRFYGTYEFNKEGKCTSGGDYFDVGGLMNAVKPK